MEQQKIIRKILDEISAGKPSGYLVRRPLSDKIDLAKVWTEKPSPGKPGCSPYGLPDPLF